MATLRELIGIKVGQNGRKMSVFEATMRLVGNDLERLNKTSSRPGEEVLTASLLGLIVATFPWCVEVFGPDNVPGATCEWSQFKKHGSGPDSESRKGADFALIVKVPDGKVRVAIFQAKHDGSESIPDGHIKLHHKLRGERLGGAIQTQMGKLHDLGCDMLRRSGNPSPGAQDLGWVHYFAQITDGLKCVQLSQLPGELAIELNSAGKPNYYEVPDNATSFHDVLVDAIEATPRFWHEFDLNVVNACLPDLLELMTAWVGDDKQGGSVEPVMSNGQPNPAKELLISETVPTMSEVKETLESAISHTRRLGQ